MTRAFDNPAAQRIKQLLESVGVESIEEARQNVEAFEHDWRRPRYFSRDQLIELKCFAESVAAAASEKFTQFYHIDFAVTTDSISQHFANEFMRRTPDENNPNFFLLFGNAAAEGGEDAGPWGLVGIPGKTALAWTTQSLGQSDSDEDPTRSLSQLESSLLLDIAALFVEALSGSYENHGANIIGQIVSGQFPLELEDTKELCKIVFNTKTADSQDDPEKAFLLMFCDKLEPAAKIIRQDAKTISAEDASRAIAKHLNKLPVSVAVHLGSASIAFGDLMNLAANDVLLLDTKVNEPVSVIAGELELFHALPAKLEGKYALAITEPIIAKRR
jgi:flagellar motor switch protein FliM